MRPSINFQQFTYTPADDDKLVAACFRIMDRHLGADAVKANLDMAGNVIRDWIINSRTKSPNLKQSLKELEHIQKLTVDLYHALRDIGGPAGTALWEAYTMRFNGPEYDHANHHEIQDALMHFRSIVDAALETAPSTSRWKPELKPETELIRDLARLYEKITGKAAKAGHYRRSDEGTALYNGPFFDLVEDIFLTLKIEKHTQGADEEIANQNLGKAIDRALK